MNTLRKIWCYFKGHDWEYADGNWRECRRCECIHVWRDGGWQKL